MDYHFDFEKTTLALDIIFETSRGSFVNDKYNDAVDLAISCLAEMMTTDRPIKAVSSILSYSHVIKIFNKHIHLDNAYDYDNDLFSNNNISYDEVFLIELINDFINVLEWTKIHNINAYMKSCIWTSLANFKVQMHRTVNQILGKYATVL